MIFDDLLSEVNELVGSDQAESGLRGCQVFRVEEPYISFNNDSVDALPSPMPYAQFCICFRNHVLAYESFPLHETGMPSVVTTIMFTRGDAGVTDEDGTRYRMVTTKGGWGRMPSVLRLHYESTGELRDIDFGQELTEEDRQDLPGDLRTVPGLIHTHNALCRFLQFLSCKNVRANEVVPPAALQKARSRRQKPPLVTFKVLELTSSITGGGGDKKGLWSNRVHLCRGHFANYTSAAPLFGKHIGRFWIPPHARGNKSIGIVHKHYSIPAGAVDKSARAAQHSST